MKIIHTSDWHLGKTVFGHSMIEDQEYFVRNFFLSTVKTELPDLILISGDIFDKPLAPLQSIRLFNEIIEFVSDLGISIIVISGNHDSIERISVGASILKKKNIFIVHENQTQKKTFTIKDKESLVNVYMVPFLQEGLEDIVADISKNLNKDAFNILVSHCFVTGCNVCNCEEKLSVGLVDQVSDKVFREFDYVALGHLHSRKIISKNLFYSGAPIMYSFDENCQKSINIINIKGKRMSLTQKNINPLRRMRKIIGSFNEIINIGKSSPSQDYLLIELTDNQPIYMPMTQLRVFFPNILAIKSEFVKSQNEKNTKVDALFSSKISDREIFIQFMNKVCNETPTKHDINIFEDEMLRLYKREDEQIVQ